MYLIYVLRDLPPACSLWWWKCKLSGKYTCTTVSVEASIPSLDKFTECPLVFSAGAVEVASMEAFTEALVEANLPPSSFDGTFRGSIFLS